jgi:hypothetical protein
VVICWAVVFAAAILAAVIRKRWAGMGLVLIGGAIVGLGIGASALLSNAAGAVILSAALLVGAYIALKGIIQIMKYPEDSRGEA